MPSKLIELRNHHHNIFSLSSYRLNVIGLDVFYLVFVLLDVLWGSWICGFLSAINFEKFLAMITSNSSFPPFLASSSDILIMSMVLLFWLPNLSGSSLVLLFCLLFFFFFLLYLRLESFCWPPFKFTVFSPGCVKFTDVPVEAILLFCYYVIDF